MPALQSEMQAFSPIYFRPITRLPDWGYITGSQRFFVFSGRIILLPDRLVYKAHAFPSADRNLQHLTDVQSVA